MHHSDWLRPIPRAHVDAIRTPYDALLLIMLAMDSPLRHQTILLTLDAEHCGHGVLIVKTNDDANAVLDLVDEVAEEAETDPDVAGLIVANVRPEGGIEYQDLDRWETMSGYCDDFGLQLVEWFVLGESIACPRQLCGAAPRWAA